MTEAPYLFTIVAANTGAVKTGLAGLTPFASPLALVFPNIARSPIQ